METGLVILWKPEQQCHDRASVLEPEYEEGGLTTEQQCRVGVRGMNGAAYIDMDTMIS